MAARGCKPRHRESRAIECDHTRRVRYWVGGAIRSFWGFFQFAFVVPARHRGGGWHRPHRHLWQCRCIFRASPHRRAGARKRQLSNWVRGGWYWICAGRAHRHRRWPRAGIACADSPARNLNVRFWRKADNMLRGLASVLDRQMCGSAAIQDRPASPRSGRFDLTLSRGKAEFTKVWANNGSSGRGHAPGSHRGARHLDGDVNFDTGTFGFA